MVQQQLDQVTDSFGLAGSQELLTFYLYFDQSKTSRCGDAMFVIFFRGVAVWTVPQCPPHYYSFNPYGTVTHFFT